MTTQELKQKFQEVFANSPLKNASQEAQDKFVDGLVENYMKLFISNLSEELSDEQASKLEEMNTAEEMNAYLESLDVDYESIAADSAFAIIQITSNSLSEAKGFVEGSTFNNES